MCPQLFSGYTATISLSINHNDVNTLDTAVDLYMVNKLVHIVDRLENFNFAELAP